MPGSKPYPEFSDCTSTLISSEARSSTWRERYQGESYINRLTKRHEASNYYPAKGVKTPPASPSRECFLTEWVFPGQGKDGRRYGFKRELADAVRVLDQVVGTPVDTSSSGVVVNGRDERIEPPAPCSRRRNASEKVVYTDSAQAVTFVASFFFFKSYTSKQTAFYFTAVDLGCYDRQALLRVADGRRPMSYRKIDPRM